MFHLLAVGVLPGVIRVSFIHSDCRRVALDIIHKLSKEAFVAHMCNCCILCVCACMRLFVDEGAFDDISQNSATI